MTARSNRPAETASETGTDVELSSRHLSGFDNMSSASPSRNASRKHSMKHTKSDKPGEGYNIIPGLVENLNEKLGNTKKRNMKTHSSVLPKVPICKVPLYFQLCSKNPLLKIQLPAEHWNAALWIRRGVCLLSRVDLGK